MKIAGFIPIFFLALCFSAPLVHAQNKAKAKTTYSLVAALPQGARQNYKLTEKLNGTRILPDSSTYRYERTLTYFITQQAAPSVQDGFAVVRLNIDSALYHFSDGKKTIDYNSQLTTQTAPLGDLADLQQFTAPMNRTVLMTLSPYGEVVDVKGEDLEWLKNYILEDGKSVLDTVQKFVWLDGISLPVWRGLFDVTHGIIPQTAMPSDSAWKRNFTLRLCGISFDGAVTSSVKNYSDQLFTIYAEGDSLRPTTATPVLPGGTFATGFSRINGGLASSRILMTMNKQGVIRRAEIQGNASFFGAINFSPSSPAASSKSNFHETITSSAILELTGQFKW